MIRHILFVHNNPGSFVQTDLALLRQQYAVREWVQPSRAVNMLALARAVVVSDLVFGWFASWHTFFPVLLARWLQRPVVLVIGGYDTANMPEIQYGNRRGSIKHQIACVTMRAATQLITHSRYTRDEAIQHNDVNPNRVTVAYHGLEATLFPSETNKENLVLTIGNVDRPNLQRKGLEPFVRAAALVPEIPFILIGAWRDKVITYLRTIASSNVQFTGWVDVKTLRDYLRRAKVYAQISRHEGFGLAVAEAMLSKCVPVVTRAGALPEVVGETGVYVDSPDPRAVADGVRRAIALDDGWGSRARGRIVGEFPLQRRREGLYSVVEKALKQHG